MLGLKGQIREEYRDSLGAVHFSRETKETLLIPHRYSTSITSSNILWTIKHAMHLNPHADFLYSNLSHDLI